MSRYPVFLITVLFAALFCSCREDFTYRSSTGELRFSRDTVYLDTVFNSLSTSTYNLKVYNTSNDDIRIPEVTLENGENSAFRLNVNGQSGKTFTDVEIPAKDSIYVFIEGTFDITDFNGQSFLATDAINFGNTTSRQQVHLVTLVRDAVFLFPDRNSGITETIPIGTDESGEEIRISGFELDDDELIFTNEKPYVIYGYAAVPPGKTLEIMAGSRLHFHEGSGILVQDGASIKVTGELSSDPVALENEVIFEGDRLEPLYSTIPGQWGTIWLAPGSIDNSIRHLTVKNAIVGMLVEGNAGAASPKLLLENTRFLNSSNVNILARNTSIRASNTVTGNAGQVSLYLTEGGNYQFTHCTVANFWNSGLRNFPALLIDNFRQTDGGTAEVFPLAEANFTNSVITGNANVELVLNNDPSQAFNIFFDHCLLQFETTNSELLNNPLYDFENTSIYKAVIRNQDPGFEAPLAEKFRLTPGSAAIDAGNPATLADFPLDISGMERDELPDAGAFEFSGN
ncbi:choice-of-anchor Q domain-containing protein [Robertkochia flava]|uniref:choice-of-anchor Q domain-containing protein n=1 Tax=Robertkochia flava TaxID=3447986 RepID=UPI001CCEAFB6|nr:choice-of-anchor Q domain-containing protein [Robertkochia marina]